MSDSLPNIAIGEFAEALLNSEAISPLHESQATSMPTTLAGASYGTQVDISNVDVSEDFMSEVFGGKETNSYLNSILEGAGPQQSLPRPKVVPVKEKVVNQTERLSSLIEQLTMVLSETKQLLSEMAIGPGTTAVGTNGTGYSTSPKKKKKKKRRSVEETVKSVLRSLQNERN